MKINVLVQIVKRAKAEAENAVIATIQLLRKKARSNLLSVETSWIIFPAPKNSWVQFPSEKK